MARRLFAQEVQAAGRWSGNRPARKISLLKVETTYLACGHGLTSLLTFGHNLLDVANGCHVPKKAATAKLNSQLVCSNDVALYQSGEHSAAVVT
jgi:hypothetical protein